MAYIIDQKNYSVCHRCRVECPAEAIRLKNDKYWIDPDKCVDCGTCESVCHNGAISNPNVPKAQVAPHDVIKMECDICVIGAGAAGMVAAAKAQDMGARVIVLEKNHEIGGSAWYATGFSVHYSKLHQEVGRPDNREKTYEQFLKRTAGYDIDKELLKRLFAANGDWIDWLIDEHNFRDLYEFNPKMPPMMPPMDMGGDDPDMDGGMPMFMMGPPAQPIAKGPFYAVKMTIFHENSMGGMVIDKNTAVLKDGQPIPGLFAAGDTTRGVMIPGEIGVQYIEGVFTALTYAFNSGYISGIEATKHALK